MASLQSQTYANTGDAYYIRAGIPVVPGDTAIPGPVEIAPAISDGTPAYYNQFKQTNAQGLQISENRLAGNVLLSDIKLTSDPIFSPSIVLSTYSPTAQRASLSISPENSLGLIKVRADAGLVVGDKSASGTSLQIYHDPTNNRNTIRNYQSSGAELGFEGNSGEIKITSPLSGSSITVPSTAEYIIVSNNGSPLKTNQFLNNGIVMNEGTPYGGRLGTLGGTGMTLDSKTNITLRTNYGATPLTNITCNTDGSVTFLNTITASIGNFLTSITAPIVNSTTINNAGTIATNIINAVSGTIGTFNSTTGNITTVNSTTGNITTVNSTTVNNTGLTTTGTLTVNTSASIPAITNLATINTIPIAQFGVPVGTVFPWAGISGTMPSGYLLCDGTYYPLVGTYAALGAIIGQSYGPPIVDQFAVPDLRTKAVFGTSSSGGAGNYTFTATGGSFSSYTTGTNTPPANPAGGNYPARQILVITSIQAGFMLFEGDQIGNGGFNGIIAGLINYDGTWGSGKQILVVLQNPIFTDFIFGTNFTVSSSYAGNTQNSENNYTNQRGREVGIHTHGTVATSSSNNASAASGRSEPNFSQPINQPNGQYTINSVTYTVPYSAINLPSAVFMSYIIKY